MSRCFDQLTIPWKKARDLDSEMSGSRLEENFRIIDQWANKLEDHCNETGGGCPPVAGARVGFFQGTVAAADTLNFNGSNLAASPVTDLTGDMEWDSTSGAFTVPRDGFYTMTLALDIDASGLADPYWVQLVIAGGDNVLLPPYGDLVHTRTTVVYALEGEGFVAGLWNNITASGDVPFSRALVTFVETPCSSIEGAS